MYETVKIVKGYAITRLIGTHGFYWVKLGENRSKDFRTIKAAVAYIEAML